MRALRPLDPHGGCISRLCFDPPSLPSKFLNPPNQPSVGSTGGFSKLTVTGGGTGSGEGDYPGHERGLAGVVCDTTAGTWGSADAGDCVRTYPWKSSVTLTAAADPGSSFGGWSGACTGTRGPCKVTMTQARNVQASFSGRWTALVHVEHLG